MPNSPTQCNILKFVGLISMAATLTPASANAATTSEGTAYRVDNGAAAYRESHMLFHSGGRPARLVLYRCIDGSAFARKTVVQHSDAATPDFDFIDGRTGYREGVRSSSRGREVFWQKSATSAERTKVLEIPVNGVIDAGFDAMVRTHWIRLGTGNKVSANFLLPSAQRFLDVSIEPVKPVKSEPVEGVTHLRMKLDTWYGFAAPGTDLFYRSSDQRLLRFRGIGTIRDVRGGNQAVRIEFPDGLQGRQANASEIAAARRLPLTGRCGA